MVVNPEDRFSSNDAHVILGRLSQLNLRFGRHIVITLSARPASCLVYISYIL